MRCHQGTRVKPPGCLAIARRVTYNLVEEAAATGVTPEYLCKTFRNRQNNDSTGN